MTLRILALDTTNEFGGIALTDGERLSDEIPLHSPEGFAHIIFGEIQRLLARHSLMLRDLDGFASASGPGSFTGVRVGLTAVKGLAEATGRRVVAVSNLRALASFGTRPLRAPVLDARRGEIYGAVYDACLRPVQDEVVMPLTNWLATLPQGELEIITSGFNLPPVQFPIIEAGRSLAGAIARIAAQEFNAGRAKDPAEIDANYVRRSDAELLWKEP
ncbi:MAG: tRNA (adenosine(37)-N6)-threonylcarbamoyltransferase complex dimerization subunit type 1 TsaB [Bryobacterales bacterium]|nr:tRNA (adenosine(37)-N6)-threonylcarbamoyltransferase complex dimerization subunit type 1 TsaB [Bryobacterales bacterium]MBV9398719.1 tRNA (adenosine(37)-N6)-threonylcarbamoyltransferase complex dimerization subunit type 1 TsaB [Bryobacterales bacterium]